MSTSVDNRVVQMDFRNQQFEHGIAQSIRSLDKLKDGLKMEQSAKHLADITKAADAVTLKGILNSIDTVTEKFSAFNVFKSRIFQNIADDAYRTGKQLIKSLSVDQVEAGWSKYEDKTKAVQTIVNATGLSIDEVNAQLEKLNWFTDETSYNFVDMVSNIGKFTSSGVDLDTAVTAMMGIANEAALAGQGVNEASRAMYNFAQAIGTGSVKLMDWRSIENANMATTQFKETIIDTALELGTLKKSTDGVIKVNMKGEKAMEVSAKNFNEALSTGWFTSEVLLKSLGKFGDYTNAIYDIADGYDTCAEAMAAFNGEGMELGEKAFKAAQEAKTLTDAIDATKDAVSSGWMKTYEIIFGNYEQAKVLWTDLANYMWDIFASGAEARNDLLEEWANYRPVMSVDVSANYDEWVRNRGETKYAEFTGRELLVNSFHNALDGLLDVIDAVKSAFSEIFPPVTAEKLYELTEKFEKFTQKFKMSEDQLDRLKTVFKGFFATINLGIKAVKSLFSLFGNLVSKGKPVTDWLGQAILSLSEFMIALNDGEDFLTSFGEKFPWLKEKVQPVIDKVKSAIDTMKEAFNSAPKIDLSGFKEFIGKFKLSALPIEKVATFIANTFSGIVNAIKSVFPTLIKIGTFFVNIVKDIFTGIVDTISGFNAQNIGNIAGTGAFVSLLFNLSGLSKGFKKEGKGLIQSIKSIFTKGGGLIDSIKKIFSGLTDTLSAFQQKVKAQAIKEIAIALAILAGAIFVLAIIDPDRLSSSLSAMMGIMIEMMATLYAMRKISGTKGGRNLSALAKSLISMAAAIFILSLAMLLLSKLDKDQIGLGIIAIGLLVAIMTASAKVMNSNSKKMKSASKGLIAMALSIVILAIAIKMISDIPSENLWNAVGAITFLIATMAILAAMTKVVGGSGMSFGKSMGLIAMAGAIIVLVSAMKMISNIPVKQIIKGLGTVGALMLMMGIFARAVSGTSGVFTAALAMVLIAAAMRILLPVLKEFGWLKIDKLAKGLGTMAIALLIMTTAMRMAHGAMSGAAALLLMATAMNVLVPVISKLGSLSLVEIGKGLLALFGVLALLVAAAWAISPIVPALLSFSAAVIGFGVGCVITAVGILGIVAALGLLFTVIAGSGKAFEILWSAVAQLPAIFVAAGDALLVAIVDLITHSSDALREAIAALIGLIVGIFADNIGPIIEGVLKIVDDVLISVADHIPSIIDKVVALVTGIINALAERMPEFIKSIVNFIGSIFRGISDAIGPLKLETFVNTLAAVGILALIIIVLAGIKPYIKDAIIAGAASALIMLTLGAIFMILRDADPLQAIGLATAMAIVLAGISICMVILSAIPVTAALGAIANLGIAVAGIVAIIAILGGIAQIPGFSWLMSEGTNVLGMIGTAIGSFFGNMVGGFASGATSHLPDVGQNLADFMTNAQPFFDNLDKIDESALNGVKILAETILLLTASDLLSGITSWLSGSSEGESPIVKFANEIAEIGPALAKFGESVKDVDSTAIEKSANAAKILAEFAQAIPNEGGWMGTVFGENSMTKFAAELLALAPSLVAYGAIVRDLDSDVVERSASAATALAEFAKAIPNNGGWLGSIMGENSLSEFAKELMLFAPSMMAYATSVKGIDPDVVKNSANIGLALAEMASALPNTGGVVGFFAGNNDMSDFGEGLVSFGTSLKEFSDTITDANFGNMRIMSGIIKSYVEIAQDIDKVGSKELSKLGSAIVKMVDDFIDGFEGKTDTAVTSAEEFMETVISSMVDAATNAETRLKASGRVLVGHIRVGITNSKTALTNIGSSAVKWMSSAINNARSSFMEAGKNLIQGLIEGLRDPTVNTYMMHVLDNMTYRMKQAVLLGLDEHSPSKFGEEAGKNLDAGLINGVEDGIPDVVNSTTVMTDKLRSAFTDALAASISIMDENDVYMPTIRPVLDTSSVESSAYSMRQLFQGFGTGGAYSRSIAAFLSMDNRKRRGTMSESKNKDVVAAIEALGERMDLLDQDIMNMQIVLDSGKTVGGLHKKMDKKLGTTVRNKKRGIK